MDQINQLKNNLRQTRDNLNSVIGQINQQLQNSEQIVDNLSNQMVNQQRNFNQLGTTTQFGGGFGTSQYQPQQTGGFNQSFNQTGRTNFGSQPYNPKYTGSTYLSSTGPGNLTTGRQYSNQPSSMQGGLNQYGAKYNSGNIDTDIGQSYYQSGQNQTSNFGQNSNMTGSTNYGSQPYNPKYTGSTYLSSTGPGNLNTGRQYSNQPSSMQGGLNQYGAKYNSGNIDTDVGESYYQSMQNQTGGFTQNINQTGTRSQYNPSQIPGANQSLGSFTNQAGQNNYNQPSSQRNSGVNQYGALYNSGIQDDDVSQSYYQSNQGF